MTNIKSNTSLLRTQIGNSIPGRRTPFPPRTNYFNGYVNYFFFARFFNKTSPSTCVLTRIASSLKLLFKRVSIFNFIDLVDYFVDFSYHVVNCRFNILKTCSAALLLFSIECNAKTAIRFISCTLPFFGATAYSFLLRTEANKLQSRRL